MKGRKRHLAVDTLGLVVRALVHPANWSDIEGAHWLLRRVPLFARWRKLLLDGGYASDALLAYCQTWFGVEAEIVTPPPGQAFQVLPKRWVVERTFAWLGKWRRLSKDYEHLPATTEAWVYIAMSKLMLRRLTT